MTEIEPKHHANRDWSESDKIYYATTTQLIAQSEATTWTRLSGFAIFSGLLINAILAPNLGPATTVVAFEPGYAGQRAGLALLGFVCSVAYCLFMVRSRKFVAEYVLNARRIEARYAGYGPFSSVRDPRGLSSQAAAPMLPFIGATIFLAMVSLNSGAAPTAMRALTVVGGVAVLVVLLVAWVKTNFFSGANGLAPQVQK